MARTEKKDKNIIENSIPSLFLEWDREGRITAFNKYLSERCGFKIKEEFAHKFTHVQDLFIYPSLDDIEKLPNKEKQKKDFSIFVKHNTENRFLLIVDSLQLDKETERYRISFKVESESFDSKMTDDAPYGMFISTPEGRFMKVNQTLVNIYGYSSKNEMLKIDNISEKIYANPEDRHNFITKIKEQKFDKENKNKKIIKNFKYIAKRVDGRRILIKKYVIATYELGKISYFQGYVEDASRYMEHSPIPYFRCDMEGNFIYANQPLCKWLEYSKEEIYQKRVKELYLNPEDAKYWSQKLHKKKKLTSSPRTFKSRNGELIKTYVDVFLQEQNGKALYVDGHLYFNPQGAISLSWAEELEKHLSTEKYKDLIFAQVNKLRDEMKIVDLGSEDIKQLAVAIQNVIQKNQTHFLNTESIEQLSSDFSIEKKYSLEKQVELAVWHCLAFFKKKKELLKDSLNLSQISQVLGLSKKEIEKKRLQGEIIGIEENGEYSFPLCQLDIREKNGIVSQLPLVLKLLQLTDLEKLSWLEDENFFLSNRKPIDILRNGTAEEKQLVKDEAFSVGDC